jgi:hypothetical protein
VLERAISLLARQTHLANRSSLQTADQCDHTIKLAINATIGSTKMFAPANLQILSPATTDLAP